MTSLEAGRQKINTKTMAAGILLCESPNPDHGGVGAFVRSLDERFGQAQFISTRGGKVIFKGCNVLKAGKCELIRNRIAPDCPFVNGAGTIENGADKSVIIIPTPRFELTLDRNAHELTASNRDEPIELSRTEYTVLELLFTNYGRVVSKNQIIDALYPDGHGFGDTTLVEQHIAMLRRKIDGPDRNVKTSFVKTKRGQGYIIPRPKTQQATQ